MSRLPRCRLKTSFFHVIVQGLNKSYIFNQELDIKYYIKLMYEFLNEYDIKIISYCIMNNHAHILVKTAKIYELSSYMQKINSKYGIYYNKKYKRVGYVFRDRYKSEGIYNLKHLYSCIKYIYDNPVKAGICESPSEYPYSNYKFFPAKDSEECIFIDIEEEKEANCKQFIKEFLKSQNLELCDLLNHKELLSELITRLNNNYKMSLRKISVELNIGRETIRKLYQK